MSSPHHDANIHFHHSHSCSIGSRLGGFESSEVIFMFEELLWDDVRFASPARNIHTNQVFSHRELLLTGQLLFFGPLSVNPGGGCGQIPAHQNNRALFTVISMSFLTRIHVQVTWNCNSFTSCVTKWMSQSKLRYNTISLSSLFP